MRLSKSLTEFCRKNKLNLIQVNYWSNGQVSIGFDIVKTIDNNFYVAVMIEPANSSTNKWFVKQMLSEDNGYCYTEYSYSKNMKEVVLKLRRLEILNSKNKMYSVATDKNFIKL